MSQGSTLAHTNPYIIPLTTPHFSPSKLPSPHHSPSLLPLTPHSPSPLLTNPPHPSSHHPSLIPSPHRSPHYSRLPHPTHPHTTPHPTPSALLTTPPHHYASLLTQVTHYEIIGVDIQLVYRAAHIYTLKSKGAHVTWSTIRFDNRAKRIRS